MSSSQHRLPGTAPVLPSGGACAASTAVPSWRSEDLLAGAQEAWIVHAEAVYRLRLTAQGKLILTK